MPILFCVKQDRINMSKLRTTTLSMLPGPRRGSSSQSKIKAIVVPCGPASFNFWHLEPGAELLASYGYPYAWLNVALDIWRSRIRCKSCIGTATFLHASTPTIMPLGWGAPKALWSPEVLVAKLWSIFIGLSDCPWNKASSYLGTPMTIHDLENPQNYDETWVCLMYP